MTIWKKIGMRRARGKNPLIWGIGVLALLLTESGIVQAGTGGFRFDPGMATGIFSIVVVSAMLLSDRILRK